MARVEPDPQVTCRGVSSISMRKVSMGVSPISLKKKRCSRHFSPMDRSAGRRRRSLANLEESRVRGVQETLATLSCVSKPASGPKTSPEMLWRCLSLRFPYVFKTRTSLPMCGWNIYLLKTGFSIFKLPKIIKKDTSDTSRLSLQALM